MRSDHVVLLFSGGVDSTVLAALALEERRRLTALFIDYGQPAAEPEALAAQGFLAPPWRDRCRSSSERASFVRRSLNLGDAVRPMLTPPRERGPRVVPGRNLAMLAIARSLAETEGADEVWYGATAEDAASYPDCRPTFVAALNAIPGPRIVAPLLTYTRTDVLRLAAELGVEIGRTWSCYAPLNALGFVPCGECDSCRQPRVLFGGVFGKRATTDATEDTPVEPLDLERVQGLIEASRNPPPGNAPALEPKP